jgi:hypothetical protein
VAGQSYFYEMDDYRKTVVLVEVIQLDLINRSVLIRLPNGGERDSEYAKLLSHLVSPTNNASDRTDPIATPTTIEMNGSSSQVIECYIQDLYSSSTEDLQCKLTELGIPFEGEVEQSKEERRRVEIVFLLDLELMNIIAPYLQLYHTNIIISLVIDKHLT